MGMLLYASFQGGPPWRPGEFTLSRYIIALSSGIYTPLLNTLIFTAGKTILSVSVGIYVAWLTVRTDTPLRWIVDPLIVIPLLLPHFLQAIALVFLFSPRIGFMNDVTEMIGLGRVFNIYGFPGMIFAASMSTVGYCYLILASAFRNMDPSYEESARMSGSSAPTVLRTITLPILRPALLSATLLAFVAGFSAFDSPLVLGLPAGIDVFSTEIYIQTRRIPSDYPYAAALSVFITIIAIFLVVAQRKLLSRSERFVTVTGRGSRQTVIKFGKWRYLTGASLIVFLVFFILLPLIVFALFSMFKVFSLSSISIDKLDFSAYLTVWNDARVDRAFINTFVVSLFAAAGATALGFSISYVLLRTETRLKGMLENIGMLPLSMPAVVIAIGMLWAYVKTPIYGTIWVLVVAYLVYRLPFAIRTTFSPIGQIHKELEEASSMSGASRLTTIRRVIIPLVKPALLSAFLVNFLLSVNLLAIPILLQFPGGEVLSVIFLDKFENQLYSQVAAIGVYMVLIVTSSILIARKLLKIQIAA
jgi:iron(III) transport system permease protein